MDTPAPSAEVYIMIGIIVVAVIVIVVRCLLKRWLTSKSPEDEEAHTKLVRKREKIMASKPPKSTMMIAVISTGSSSPFNNSISPRDVTDCTAPPKLLREGSNISEWYYSLEENGRPATGLSVHSVWPPLAPVEETNSEDDSFDRSLNRVESECSIPNVEQTPSRSAPSTPKSSTPVIKVKAAHPASKAVSFASPSST